MVRVLLPRVGHCKPGTNGLKSRRRTCKKRWSFFLKLPRPPKSWSRWPAWNRLRPQRYDATSADGQLRILNRSIRVGNFKLPKLRPLSGREVAKILSNHGFVEATRQPRHDAEAL